MIMPPLSVTVHADEMWPLLQYAPLSVVVVDSNGRIVFANERLAAMFGYAPDELAGDPLETLLPERLRAIHNAHHDAYMRQPHSRAMGIGMELVGRHKSGREVPIEVGLSSYRTPDGIWMMAVVTATQPDHDVEDAVARERKRIARDLHDVVSQSLVAASFNADALPNLVDTQPLEAHVRAEEIRQLTRGALAELRTVLFELRPQAVQRTALRDLLRQLGDAAEGRGRIGVSLALSGDGDDPPPSIKIAMYRIAQEALNNVVRHGRAEHAWLRLDRRRERTVLMILDDGVGFDAAAVSGDHQGLAIMRERAAEAGLELRVASAIGEGTTVTVAWPPEAAAEEETAKATAAAAMSTAADAARALAGGPAERGA